MSTDREQIFGSIRKALEPLEERTAYPEWEAELSDSRFAPGKTEGAPEDLLAERLRAANGVMADDWSGLRQFLESEGVTRGYIDAELRELAGGELDGFDLETALDRKRIDEYGVGLTRVSGAIAETGSVILKDTDTPYRLAALAPWIHVAVVRRSEVLNTVREAVARFGEDPSIIFATGPSKTADVEGILIEGVHGPGCQVCLLVD